MLAAGIFCGIVGLGVGFVGGLLWEQFHRHRRRERLKRQEIVEASNIVPGETAATRAIQPDDQAPRLQLVGNVSAAPLPNLAGRRLRSVRFTATAMVLDFGTLNLEIGPGAIVSCGTQKNRYPDPGSRDAICDLIGARVDRVRLVSGERVEISCDNGCEITASKRGLAVA